MREKDVAFVAHDPLLEEARVLPTPVMTAEAKQSGPRVDQVDIWAKKVREAFDGDQPGGQQRESDAQQQYEEMIAQQDELDFEDEVTNPDISLQMMSDIA